MMDTVVVGLWLLCGTTILCGTVAVIVALKYGELRSTVRRLQSGESQHYTDNETEDTRNYCEHANCVIVTHEKCPPYKEAYEAGEKT